MSEPVKTNPIPVVAKPTPPFTFNKNIATLKIQELKDFYMKFAGKKSYNPYFWIYENLKPIEDEMRLPKFIGTKELWDKLMALPKDEKLAFLEAADENHKYEEWYVAESKKLPPPPLPERPTKI